MSLIDFHSESGDLFEGLSVWNTEKYRQQQGTYPVLFISFADVKGPSYPQTRKKICGIIRQPYDRYRFLLDGNLLGQHQLQQPCW
ncbi:MAG: AAA family ATPase [Lachnospiraceae bacterium]|nr:AAA family ATPase [Lachnospiraceae bacterium]